MKRRKEWGAVLETTVPSFKQTHYQQLEHEWIDLIEDHAKCKHCGMVRRRDISKIPNSPWYVPVTTVDYYAIELPDGSIKEYEADQYVFTMEPSCKSVEVPKAMVKNLGGNYGKKHRH